MTLSQQRRLEINLHQLKAIEQNLDALFTESHSPSLRRAQEHVLRAIEAIEGVEVARAA